VGKGRETCEVRGKRPTSATRVSVGDAERVRKEGEEREKVKGGN